MKRRLKIDEEISSCRECFYLGDINEHGAHTRTCTHFSFEFAYGKVFSNNKYRVKIPKWCPLPIVGQQRLKKKGNKHGQL